MVYIVGLSLCVAVLLEALGALKDVQEMWHGGRPSKLDSECAAKHADLAAWSWEVKIFRLLSPRAAANKPEGAQDKSE